ncbi:MAG: MarR family transcriptional regulator [Hamadaea sp.]|uniref:helix-turn-helix domain-containing GNAT family N-acetyltransferase n=1 Tax=Hamadaea sp. TaxID=2024425 RepID=UPI0017F21911|nr:helix-turn-helix domain-containing GNAT family N-acetyltransferase [Hamadaea sp.]NUR74081.1 MarR family transcriptional regulator [Hamadaea sp.]NUT20225.1 MarR family transcriptional regulator [Hamadaea sp.]
MEQVTGRIREFNRYYTQRIGVLTDHYLGQRSLGEARLLYELSRDPDVRSVRARLGLDSGYLSRLLRALERQDLITLERHPEDGRARIAVFTAAGRAAVSDLDTRSDESVATLVDPLTPDQRRRLADAMDEVQRLLRIAAIEVQPVAAGSAVARSCLHEYAEELSRRFPEGYGPDDLLPASAFAFFLVASDGVAPVGCVGLRVLSPGVGEIKHMWVSPSARRLGVGRRLLASLESSAADLGFTELRLSTHEALPEAIALYQALGYAEIPPYGDDVHGQRFFSLPLFR